MASKMENESLLDTFKAMDNNEKCISVRSLPTQIIKEEIIRRERIANNLITNLLDILDKVNTRLSNMELEEKQNIINKCRKVLGVPINDIVYIEDEDNDDNSTNLASRLDKIINNSTSKISSN